MVMRQVFKTSSGAVLPGVDDASQRVLAVTSTHRFRDGRIEGFLAVESGHLALAGPVTSGVNVVCFRDAMPLTLQWSVSGSALGRGVPHETGGRRPPADCHQSSRLLPGCERTFRCLCNLASPAGRAR